MGQAGVATAGNGSPRGRAQDPLDDPVDEEALRNPRLHEVVRFLPGWFTLGNTARPLAEPKNWSRPVLGLDHVGDGADEVGGVLLR